MNALEIVNDHEAAPGEARARLDVLLVYEDLSTALRARQAFEQVRRQIEIDAEVDLWRFDLFREPALLEWAATDAAKADIVFLSAHGQGELPGTANLWLEQWFERRDGGPCALVVLPDTPAGDTAAANQRWEALRAAAVAAGVDMFLHAAEARQPERQSTLDETRLRPETRGALAEGILHGVERHSYRHPGGGNGGVEGEERGGGSGEIDARRIRRDFPEFKDQAKVIAGFGQAQLVKYADGSHDLRGGSREDRIAAREWISMFWHEAVVTEA
jgi:hypothetical protein